MNLADLFHVATLTASVNKLPFMPTKAGDLGIFRSQGIATTYYGLEERKGRLFLIANTDRDGDPFPVKRNKRNRKILQTTHLPASDVLMPSDLQGIAQFGQDTSGVQANPQAVVINDKLQILKNSVNTTREWQRVGALRGQILDDDGSVIEDLYDLFGVTKKIITIDFSDPATDVRGKIMEGKRWAEQRLFGTLTRGFNSFCSPEFFTALTTHATVVRAYANYQEARDRLGGDVRKGFTFGDVEFSEYYAVVSGQTFFPAGIGSMFPLGDGIFGNVNAPANYNETVNTMGLEFYAKAEQREMAKGWKLEVQSNPGHFCLFPEALVEFQIAT